MIPSTRVRRAWKTWERIGASNWLIRQLRFGIQIPWTRQVPYRQPRAYPLKELDRVFALQKIERCMSFGFARRATRHEDVQLRKRGCIFPTFAAETAGKKRLVVDYKPANNCIEDRTFRIDQIRDLASALHPNELLFKADVKDAYYHLRLRRSD